MEYTTAHHIWKTQLHTIYGIHSRNWKEDGVCNALQVEFLYGRQSIRPLRTFTAGEPNAALLWLAFHPAVWVAT